MARARSKSRRPGAEPKIKHRREVSAGGLIWRRNPDGPKGHIEPGETVVQAAIREAREETGLTVGAVEPLGEISYVYSSRERDGATITRIFKHVYFFLMEYTGGDPSAHDSEVDEVAWLSFDEALARATHPSEQALIAKARTMLDA
jgi:8-oxo-dGTP pyrophosphatase MutT (NUDIX family)